MSEPVGRRMIGKTLSRYEILGTVGAGGMGEVYRARDPELGRDVAIKVVHTSLSQSPDRLARFEHEARAVGAINHPNVLAVYDVGNADGLPYLVTELLDGSTLRERVDDGSLTPRKAVEYAAQIADGLAAAHSHNLVHRDLKPNNIFITNDGHVKILDFGLAKLTERDRENPVSTESPTEALTEDGLVVGTPGYMSPEQLRGQPADPRSDIFAFGIILYEMICRRRPFEGATSAEISASIMRDDPEPLSCADRPVPQTLERIVLQCLEKDPNDRFESAHDLARMLRAVSDTGQVRAVEPKPPPRQRLRRSALAAAVLVATAVVGFKLIERMPPPGLPESRHIAVLPFEATGDSPEARYLAAGLAEVIADGLKIVERETRGASWVIPFSPDLTLESARATEDATIAVMGVYRPDAQRSRLDVELVDPGSGKVFDRRTLDEDARNLTALQEGPVRLVWSMLGFEPTPAALEALEDGTTNTLAACRSFLVGRGRLATAESEAELEDAVASFDRAIEEDPGYLWPRYARAEAFARLYETTREAQWKDRAVAEAEAAIGLDNEAVEPYLVLADVFHEAGQTELQLEALRNATARAHTAGPFMLLGRAATDAGRFEEAERALETAINLRPGSSKPHSDLGYLYTLTNRLDAATNQFRYAAEAAPLDQLAHINLGVSLYFISRQDEAETAFEDALALGPNPFAYSNLGTLYFEDGRFGDAVEMFEGALELAGNDLSPNQYPLVANLASALYWTSDTERAMTEYRRAVDLGEALLQEGDGTVTTMIDLAGYYGLIGQTERGRELLEMAAEHPIENPQLIGGIAESWVDLGDKDRALEWIEKAFENGLDPKWVESRPTFNDLRGDERFRELIRRSNTVG